eukprot:m51a1_g973 hypothetical protein (466) ;mRNA; r:390884-392769
MDSNALAGLLAALFALSTLVSLVRALVEHDAMTSLLAQVRSLFSVSVTVESAREGTLFSCVDEYIGDLVGAHAVKTRRLAAVQHKTNPNQTVIEANRVPSIIYTIGEGSAKIETEKGTIIVDKWGSGSGGSGSGDRRRTIQLSSRRWDTIDEFIAVAQKRFYGRTDGKVLVYTNNPDDSWGNPWQIQTVRGERGEDSYALSDPQELIMREVSSWKDRKAASPHDPRLPHSLSFLLSGPPGAGKTSFIEFVASKFRMDVFSMTLSGMSDFTFKRTVTAVPPGSLLLLEEIDTAFGKDQRSVTMSAFLNFLDGVGTPADCLIFMTTNHVDRVDCRVYRAARSQRVEFPRCSAKGARGLFAKYFGPDVADDEAEGFGAAAAELVAAVPALCNSNLWALFTSFKTPNECTAEISRVLASSDRSAQWMPAAQTEGSSSGGKDKDCSDGQQDSAALDAEEDTSVDSGNTSN